MTVPPFAVIPRHRQPLPPRCDARHDDLTAITCDRDIGHQGDHEGFTTIRWPPDEEDHPALD